MLPPFSEENVNVYLISIGSSATDITNFYNDMNTNWLNAFQTRFTLTTADTTLLNNFPTAGKEAILMAGAQASAAANMTGIQFPVLMSISGFSSCSQSAESDADPAPVLGQDWDFKVKGKLYNKYDVPTDSMKWEYQVKVEAKVGLC